MTNPFKLKRLPRFKGDLRFVDMNEPCVIHFNDKLISIDGRKMKNACGNIYRVLFMSERALGRAKAIASECGKVKIDGSKQDGYIYAKEIKYPVSGRMKRNKLHSYREKKKYDEEYDPVLTGRHRSHEEYMVSVAKQIKVKLDKKEEEVKKEEVFEEDFLNEKDAPKSKKKPKGASRPVRDEFELEKQKEKRIEQLEHFKYVRDSFKLAGIRGALAISGFSFEEIENAEKAIRVCTKYMSHRAYK